MYKPYIKGGIWYVFHYLMFIDYSFIYKYQKIRMKTMYSHWQKLSLTSPFPSSDNKMVLMNNVEFYNLRMLLLIHSCLHNPFSARGQMYTINNDMCYGRTRGQLRLKHVPVQAIILIQNKSYYCWGMVSAQLYSTDSLKLCHETN